jgi:hypothetical protein
VGPEAKKPRKELPEVDRIAMELDDRRKKEKKDVVGFKKSAHESREAVQHDETNSLLIEIRNGIENYGKHLNPFSSTDRAVIYMNTRYSLTAT